MSEISASFIVISVILTSIVVATMVGNFFVIIAILVDKNLQTTANQLVLSLAVADLMVACLVMPLGAYNDLHQGWYLGKEACEFWTSADVLCCTASILNLLAIALDRYWAVTNVDYIYKRTRQRVNMMIFCVWTVGAVVSFAPIFGWKDPDFADRVLVEHKCMVSQDVAYQIFATISTFYTPLVLLLALYWRIFKVARKRIRRKPGRQEAPKNCSNPGSNPTTKRISTKVLLEQHQQNLALTDGQADKGKNRSSLADEWPPAQTSSSQDANKPSSGTTKLVGASSSNYRNNLKASTSPSTSQFQPESLDPSSRPPPMASKSSMSVSDKPASCVKLIHANGNELDERSYKRGRIISQQQPLTFQINEPTQASAHVDTTQKQLAPSKSHERDFGSSSSACATRKSPRSDQLGGSTEEQEEQGVHRRNKLFCGHQSTATTMDQMTVVVSGAVRQPMKRAQIPSSAVIAHKLRKLAPLIGGGPKVMCSEQGQVVEDSAHVDDNKNNDTHERARVHAHSIVGPRGLESGRGRARVAPSEQPACWPNELVRTSSGGAHLGRTELARCSTSGRDCCYCCCCDTCLQLQSHHSSSCPYCDQLFLNSASTPSLAGKPEASSRGAHDKIEIERPRTAGGIVESKQEEQRQQQQQQQINHGILGRRRAKANSTCIRGSQDKNNKDKKKRKPLDGVKKSLCPTDDETVDDFQTSKIRDSIMFGGDSSLKSNSRSNLDDIDENWIKRECQLLGHQLQPKTCSLQLDQTFSQDEQFHFTGPINSSNNASASESLNCSSSYIIEPLDSSSRTAEELEQSDSSLSAPFPPPIELWRDREEPETLASSGAGQKCQSAKQASNEPVHDADSELAARPSQSCKTTQPQTLLCQRSQLATGATGGSVSASPSNKCTDEATKTEQQPKALKSLDIRRKFRALGQLVSFVQTSRNFSSSGSSALNSSQSAEAIDEDDREREDDEESKREKDQARHQLQVSQQQQHQHHQPLHSRHQQQHQLNHHLQLQHCQLQAHRDSSSEQLAYLCDQQLAAQSHGIGLRDLAASKEAPGPNELETGRNQSQNDRSKRPGSQREESKSTGGGGVSNKRRENMDIKREKKAAKTLAIITGVFVCCWLPFFLNAIIMPICGPSCTPNDLILSVLLWLGYLNSLLNPILYTIFSPDFRRAFRRLLCWPQLITITSLVKAPR